uniref:Uncharacterized protein n=1 Tax=Heliothis virescens TaxID=7102 RepID=A0A2A4IZ50_HELVI
MQKSPEFDFSKILDQTLYTYLAEKFPKHVEVRDSHGNMSEHGEKPWSPSEEHGFVRKLRPMVVLIGVSKIIIGVVLLLVVLLIAGDYDKLYATEESRLISLMSFGGLVTLVVSGMMLLISLKSDKKKVMWYYILMSTALCVYIFVLSVMKIHFALLVLERDTFKEVQTENRHFLLSTACVVGIATMLGSVIDFISNVTVFTFYNLKYIHPILFNCGP